MTVAARLPLSEPGALGLLSPEPPVPALVSARGAFGSLRPVEVQRQRRGQLLRPLVTLRHAAWEARSADAFHSAVARVHTLQPAPARRARTRRTRYRRGHGRGDRGRAPIVAAGRAQGGAARDAARPRASRPVHRRRARLAWRRSAGSPPRPRPAPPRPAPPPTCPAPTCPALHRRGAALTRCGLVPAGAQVCVGAAVEFSHAIEPGSSLILFVSPSHRRSCRARCSRARVRIAVGHAAHLVCG